MRGARIVFVLLVIGFAWWGLAGRWAEIGHAAYYTTPLHLQPVFAHLGWRDGSLPETERAAAENLCLPLWAGVGEDVQRRVVETVRAALPATVG